MVSAESQSSERPICPDNKPRPARRTVLGSGTTLATSPLVFPSAADYAKLHRYRVLSKAEEKVWNGIFEPIYQS